MVAAVVLTLASIATWWHLVCLGRSGGLARLAIAGVVLRSHLIVGGVIVAVAGSFAYSGILGQLAINDENKGNAILLGLWCVFVFVSNVVGGVWIRLLLPVQNEELKQ